MAAALPLPELIVITDWSLGRETLLARLTPVLELGSRIAIQHRHPDAPPREFVAEARSLAERCKAAGVPLFINGRLDIALLLGAHLHLPSTGLIPTDVRRHLPGKWISLAVHSAEEARAAVSADFALVGPVFAPSSKPDDLRPPLGRAGFLALAELLPCPAFALGGVQPTSAHVVPEAAGFAAIGGVLHALAPGEAARGILETLRGNSLRHHRV